MKKALSLILTLTLLLSAMLGVTSAAEGESGAELNITSANLQFASTVYLLVSVDYSAYGIDENGAMSAVTLTVTGKDGVESAPLSADAEVMATEGFPEGAVGFKYTNLGAKNMGDELTLQAYYNGEKSGDPSVYSVLEYTIKAKEIYPSDTALALVCDTLIAFGAEAQKAFGYTEYDYDLSEKYGMVIVGGATNRKTIAKVGEVVQPTADSAVFTAADTALYDLSFDEVANGEIEVSEGVSRYFYYGSDLWGHAGTYDAKDGSVTSPNHGGNLDLDLYTGKKTILYNKDRASNTNGYKYSIRHERTMMTGEIKVLTSSGVNYGNTSDSSMRPWALESPKSQWGTGYQDGFREIGLGYLHLNACDDTETADTVAPQINFQNGYTTKMSSYLEDGKITLSISIAKKEGVTFTKNSCTWYSASDQFDIFNVTTTNYVRVGDTYITKLKEFSSETPEASDFTVLHFVFDLNLGNVTVYTDGGVSKVISVDKDTLSTVANAGGYFRWPINSGNAYINRVTVSEGDLFD